MLTSLSAGELAINTYDGKIFIRSSQEKIESFSIDTKQPFILNTELSGTIPQYGNNTINEVFANVLGGYNNDVSGAGSTTVNGENNDIAGDFAFIGNGLNNSISAEADYSAILAGRNNNLLHRESFIIGSNITSHLSGFTYVNNLSATGKVYGDGSGLTNIYGYPIGNAGGDLIGTYPNPTIKNSIALAGVPTAPTAPARTNTQQIATTEFVLNNSGDKYLTTSNTSNIIDNGNNKTFVVASSSLAYSPTQDVTIVSNSDPLNYHMHCTVVSYSGYNLVVNANSHSGNGTHTDWTINVGGYTTQAGVLLQANNLNDVSDPHAALTNIGGVSSTRSINTGIGLTGGGDLTIDRTISIVFGDTSNTAVSGNDPRLSDARTPTAHKTAHAIGGTDVLTPADIGALSISYFSTLTGNWDSVYFTVGSLSSTWGYQGTDLKALSGNWQSTYLNVNSLSSNWQSTFTTVQGQSAQWASNVDTGVRALSSNWQSTYSTVNSLSSNWNSNYTTVASNSANWQTAYAYVSSNSVNLTATNIFVNNNLTVTNTVSAKYYQGTILDWMTLVRGYKIVPTLLQTIAGGDVYTYTYTSSPTDKTYYRYIATDGSEDSFYGTFVSGTLSNLIAKKGIIL